MEMAPVKTNRTLSGLVEDWLYPNVISVLQKKDLGNQFAPVLLEWESLSHPWYCAG